jgi:poly [ADP-ribose] polymerase 2/3/4
MCLVFKGKCYNLNEPKLKSEGFNSVYAHGGIDLKNDEFMIYNSSQCRIKYIIEIS